MLHVGARIRERSASKGHDTTAACVVSVLVHHVTCPEDLDPELVVSYAGSAEKEHKWTSQIGHSRISPTESQTKRNLPSPSEPITTSSQQPSVVQGLYTLLVRCSQTWRPANRTSAGGDLQGQNSDVQVTATGSRFPDDAHHYGHSGHRLRSAMRRVRAYCHTLHTSTPPTIRKSVASLWRRCATARKINITTRDKGSVTAAWHTRSSPPSLIQCGSRHVSAVCPLVLRVPHA